MSGCLLHMPAFVCAAEGDLLLIFTVPEAVLRNVVSIDGRAGQAGRDKSGERWNRKKHGGRSTA